MHQHMAAAIAAALRLRLRLAACSASGIHHMDQFQDVLYTHAMQLFATLWVLTKNKPST